MIEANEIAPRLWMGSRPPPGPKLRQAGFHVVALCAYEYQPTCEWYPGLELTRIALDDGALAVSEAIAAFHLGVQLAKQCKMRRNVLVTCNQGRNRSGLVAAFALTQLTGCSGFEAAHAVRERRKSPFGPALSNSEFVEALYNVGPAQVRGTLTKQHARAARLAG